MERYEFDIEGMTCAACEARVGKCVSAIAGAENVNVSLLTNSMSVELKDRAMVEDVENSIEKAGYKASLKGEKKKDEKVEATFDKMYKEMKRRFFLSLGFLVPLMLISMHHMLPLPFLHKLFMLPDHAIRYSFLQFLLLLPIIYLNRKFFTNGFKALKNLSPNMDSLIAIGSSASIIYGVVAIFIMGEAAFKGDVATLNEYGSNLYFEGAGMILTLITMGKMLETRAKGKTTKALSLLMQSSPKVALVRRDGKEEMILSEEIKKGDILIIKAGTVVAADGVIKSGNLSLDQKAITGESIPVDKEVGEKVISGSVNVTGFAEVEAVDVGKDSTIQRVIKLVEEASSSKAPISRLADKIAAVFVPVVISISVLTFIVWMVVTKDISTSLSFAISVLVVSCPCALGLATPVAIMVGTGKGAKNGILYKDGEALETLGKVDVVCFDKTGTLTEGDPKVTDYKFYSDEALATKLLVTLESKSEHPLAKAVTNKFKATAVIVDEFETVVGNGIKAIYQGKVVLLGSKRFIEKNSIDTTSVDNDIERYNREGKTILLLSLDGKVIALVAMQDTEKESAVATLRELKELKIKTVMLTGDNEVVAESFKQRLALFDVKAELLPQDKVKVVKEYQGKGFKVAMVGDGINDAPSLMSADVGISISSGTEIAKESAGVVISNPSLLAVAESIKLSKKVMLNIKENLFWAFFYNSLGIPLASGVFYLHFGLKLSPMFAALAMSLSSFCVVMNALRLNSTKLNIEHIDKEDKTMDKEYLLQIDGMMCMHCVKHVKDALEAVNGVKTVEVSLDQKNAKVVGKAGLEDELKEAVTNEGYTVL